MIFFLSRRISRSHGFLVLVMTNLVTSMPIAPIKRSPEPPFTVDVSSSGFSNVPKVLEIQFPLKLASREDLVAWARYVMSLMASKINITLTTVKESPPKESQHVRKSFEALNSPMNLTRTSQLPNIQISGPRPTGLGVGHFFNERPVNFEVSSIQEINVGSPFGSKGNVRAPDSWFKDPNSRENLEILSPLTPRREPSHLFLPRYPDFNTRQNYRLNDNQILRNSSVLASPPGGMYLPLPVKTSDTAKFINDQFSEKYFFDKMSRNASGPSMVSSRVTRPVESQVPVSRRPEKIQSMTAIEPNHRPNLTNIKKPILTLPFEAVITISREDNLETHIPMSQKDDYIIIPTRDPPDEFPPYFEKNFTVTNESGQINVVLDNFEASGNKTENASSSLKEGSQRERPKKERAKKEKPRKRQSVAIAELIKVLANLRRSRNDTVSEPLINPPPQQTKGSKSQRLQLADKNEAEQENRNETSQAQELEDDYDYDDDEGGNGGSVQSLLELLPIVAPILEDLSDPESDTDLIELLQAAIPILEGLSEGDEDNPAPDIPGIIVPILLNIIRGRDGEGSDVGAILGPLVQLSAPFIGPIAGPIIGPLSQQSSNPESKEGSNIGALVQAISAPLSTPTGPGKMSPISTVIAGVVASLSKQLVEGKDGLDLKNLVSSIVSGTLWGTSAAISGGPKDSAYAPTSYGGYGGNGANGGNGGYGYGAPSNSVNPFALIGSSIKDVLNAGLKVSSSLITALSALLGASSQPKQPSYGPTAYGPPPAYVQNNNYPPSTSAPLAQNKRPAKKQQPRG